MEMGNLNIFLGGFCGGKRGNWEKYLEVENFKKTQI